jgi:hypothetical protein
MALVIHHRVSNNSGALFFTLLIARPSGRSCSTSLAGHIRAAASSGAARSQASMSSSSLYRISWVLLVAQGQSEGVGWNADSVPALHGSVVVFSDGRLDVAERQGSPQ